LLPSFEGNGIPVGVGGGGRSFFGGFFSKFVLFSSAVYATPHNGWMLWLAVSGVLNSALSLYYYARVIRFMVIEEEKPARLPVPAPMLLAVALALVGIVATGLLAGPFIAASQEAGQVPAVARATGADAHQGRRQALYRLSTVRAVEVESPLRARALSVAGGDPYLDAARAWVDLNADLVRLGLARESPWRSTDCKMC
jgi:NADH:ubiquinone oxidoreductase subunit 5 (subunit L)/multisubunit Na+/H+ antiporter MnhA subunit